jgi:hypothetical protein
MSYDMFAPVVIIHGYGQSQTEIGVSNGNLTLIGSNNPNGGPQTIGADDGSFARENGGYVLTPAL